MERSTRGALRHAVVVDVEITDSQSGIRIKERTKDLSLYGCRVSTAIPFQAVESHASKRLRQWLCAKHKERWPATKRFPQASLYGVLGLVRLTRRRRNLPWATSWAGRNRSHAQDGLRRERNNSVRPGDVWPTRYRHGNGVHSHCAEGPKTS